MAPWKTRLHDGKLPVSKVMLTISINFAHPNFCKSYQWSLTVMLCIRGKTQNHSADSLETLVENLVKTWECQVGLQRDWIGVIRSNVSLLHIFMF